MKKIQLNEIDQIIRDVAAAEIMPRFRNLSAGQVQKKSDNTFVTEADQQAERALILRFRDYLPGCAVVGEESFAEDPNIFSHFDGEDDVFVIDPIDGTSNFINGKPEFAVMVALMRRRETIAAWIHDPSSGDTLMAEQGGGLWLGGHQMRLAGLDPDMKPSAIVGSRLKKILSPPDIARLLASLPVLQTGSAAAFDYGRLFTGAALFAKSTAPRVTHLLYRQSKPWDHLAGLFMLQETRGYAATLAGNDYRAGQQDEGLLVAPTRAAWEAFHAILSPALDGLALR